ncbi:MAG: undecaprenyldiphospho-muramoylpentapeptide beta-N-acetylglucosaminyltransferase [Armatimonadetes bacterium]|nr:undecaprenyldiphospho-muramoylpentapeptide beta-N-acetylglucosaminyltransferase [Armatimonadota bacterium]
MQVIVTGGGTGGHVYPALEVAKHLQGFGLEVMYFGSLRGQESKACAAVGMPFAGFGSEPLYRLTSVRGIKGALALSRAMAQVRARFKKNRPSAVFSTGGYASAPVVGAARRLGIPYVIHEQNVVPGRTNKILGRTAYAVATTFRSGHEHFDSKLVRRTGMPIRPEFRRSEQGSLSFTRDLPREGHSLLVMGGSQGAQAINEAVLTTAARMARLPLHWTHVTGPKHFDGMSESIKHLAVDQEYELRAFLDAEEISAAMFQSALAICRSGAGSLAELAAMRKPSILIPYPAAFGNHQFHNAMEFVEMGAAELLEEPNLQPALLEARILSWLEEKDRIRTAEKAMAEWDIPDAVNRIANLVVAAAHNKQLPE